ncbi:SRPBCC domain-containing protein [Methylosinus sp. H3A]|uniref:SRPBCC domain-containing protein n=1 Tax=Methylosinus sp. H3A TaxID=2785786 RepID=UPI0018C2DE09|nr:pyridoxamine 5'-phosphate oxidase family protein [Methylosinus sp. H3A]MBG0807849.1 SRPBCC domain-containing protein [Methylosinus sp. H3A]MBG0812576.1 SRPBCC domain-containing protein [Methylosinus sp. H3A]
MTGPAGRPVSLVLVRRINAPAGQIFTAWTDPKWLVRWLIPGAGALRDAVIDPSPGGAYRLEGLDPDGTRYCLCGRYIEVAAERRIALSWEYEGAAAGLCGPPTRVDVDLRPLGADACELTLTHGELQGEEAAATHRILWTICLDRLVWSLVPPPDEPAFRPSLGAIAELYGESHRLLQDAFDSRPLANALRKMMVTSTLTNEHKAFIAGRDMVFLTTVDHRGFPTCSYKGGAPGFVRALDDQTLVLPSYNGNGMYLSAGNVAANAKVGLLFIDFEQPHRLRIHGAARLVRDEAELAAFPGAELLLVVKVYEAFVNCSRYVHRYQRAETSPFVPGEPRGDEMAPWKNLDVIRDALPGRDRVRREEAGSRSMTREEYLARLKRGES